MFFHSLEHTYKLSPRPIQTGDEKKLIQIIYIFDFILTMNHFDV